MRCCFCFIFMMLAYIDPGLGALLWQTIIAALVGFLFYLKKTRRWIVNLFRKMFGPGGKTEVTTPVIVTPEAITPKVETKTEAR
jgi:hypothetical protein